MEKKEIVQLQRREYLNQEVTIDLNNHIELKDLDCEVLDKNCLNEIIINEIVNFIDLNISDIEILEELIFENENWEVSNIEKDVHSKNFLTITFDYSIVEW